MRRQKESSPKTLLFLLALPVIALLLWLEATYLIHHPPAGEQNAAVTSQ